MLAIIKQSGMDARGIRAKAAQKMKYSLKKCFSKTAKREYGELRYLISLARVSAATEVCLDIFSKYQFTRVPNATECLSELAAI